MELFISDLDGTLLNAEQEISEYTAQTINGLIERGLNFSIATARSITSAGPIIQPLKLKLPIILHNGVFVYDPVGEKNIAANYIPQSIGGEVIHALAFQDLSPFVFTYDAIEGYKIYYRGVFNQGQKHFVDSRLMKKDRRFTLTTDYHECATKDIISITTIGEKTALEPSCNLLRYNYKLHCHFAEDIYSKAYWLEITNANKQTSIAFLKSYLGAERLICFGDHLNDCPMFELADEGYAVSNAHEIVKQMATGVIESNTADGVARFLAERLRLQNCV